MTEEISSLKQIKLFVYDFDGVMTDNTFILDGKGIAKIINGDQNDLLIENQSTYIPFG